MDVIGNHRLNEISQAQRDKSISLRCGKLTLVKRVKEMCVDKEKKMKTLVAPCARDFLFPEDIVRKWQGGMEMGI